MKLFKSVIQYTSRNRSKDSLIQCKFLNASKDFHSPYFEGTYTFGDKTNFREQYIPLDGELTHHRKLICKNTSSGV